MELFLLCLLSQGESPCYQGKIFSMQQFVLVRIHVEQVIGRVQKKYKLVHKTLPTYQLDQMSIGQQ